MSSDDRNGLVQRLVAWIRTTRRSHSVVIVAALASSLALVAGLFKNSREIVEFLTPKNEFQAQVSAAVSRALEGPWTDRCGLVAPAGWTIGERFASPPIGSVLDNAGIGLNVGSGSYVFENEYFSQEFGKHEYERWGFVLTYTDRTAALAAVTNAEVARRLKEDLEKDVDVIGRKDLRFKVEAEDGAYIASEEVQITRTRSGEEYVIEAHLLPTRVPSAFYAGGPRVFPGLRTYSCGGSTSARSTDVVRMCLAVMERTLTTHTWDGRHVSCDAALDR